MAIEPSSSVERTRDPNVTDPTPDQPENNNPMLSTISPAPADGAVDSIVTTTNTPVSSETNTSPAPTEANTNTSKFLNISPPPGRTVDGLMEAPDRSDAVEPRASDHSRPGPAFGCREGVFQASLSGEYTYPTARTTPVPDDPSPNSPQHPPEDSDNESVAEHADSAAQTAPALALQWNICGLSTRHAELELLIKTHRPHVIALQEVQTKQVRKRLENGGYDWEFAFPPGEVSKNGAALGIGKDISHEFLRPDTTLQAVAAKVEWPIQATFVSLYVSKNDGKATLREKLEKLLDQLPGPVVLLGDWNAHSDLWGGNTLDERGRAIEDFVSSNQLIVLNSGAHTRIDFHDGHTSAIDLSIVSESLARRLSWEVMEDNGGSDHFPIVIRDMDSKPVREQKRPRWVYDKADWRKFQEALCLPSTVSAEALEAAIVSAAESSIPRTSTKVCRRAVHWWNQSAETAIRSRKKALRKLRKMKPDDPRKPEALEAFKAARRASRKATKEAKTQSWTAFVTGISPALNTKEVWRRINTFRNGHKTVISRITTPGGVLDDPLEIANAIADQFYRASADDNLHPEHVEKRNGTSFSIDHAKYDDHYYNSVFSMAELHWAVNRGKGSSDGIDHIGYQMLQHLPAAMEEYLLEVLNQAWTTGKIPQRWKEGLVVPIPKADKDPTIPANLRPITLVSCVGKTLERMVNRRLTQLLEAKGVFGARQHGFRSGHGVDTYLADLEEDIDASIQEGKHTELALLDLAKAYDTAWRAPIVANLAKWGIGGNMGRYMEDFLTDRTFRVTIGGALSTLRVLENGVPQGTVIAVTGFLIRMTEVEAFIPAGIEMKLYADDILLFTSGKKAGDVRKKLQKAVKAVETWTTLYGFQLSASKSQLLHVCRKNRHLDLPDVATDDGPMDTVKTAKLLGIAMDSRFRFWKHIEDTKRNAARSNRILAVLGGHLAAGARTTMLMAQRAIIQSRLFYGWGLISSASTSRRNRLEAGYNAGIRSASGAFKSSPISAIMAEAGVLPFKHEEALQLVNKGAQIQALAEPGTNRAVFVRSRERFGELTGEDLPDVERVTRTSDRPWNEASPEIDWTMHQLVRAGDNAAKVAAAFGEVLERYRHDRKIYTDGSMKDGVVGAGVVDGSTELTYRLPEQCSVFSAEAYAILKGLEEVPRDGSRLVVFSDSLSVLAAVESGSSKHPWIQGIETAMLNRETTLVWIPGHTSIAGNDLADAAAKRANEREAISTPVPKQDLLRWAREIVRATWEKEWFDIKEVALRRIKPTTIAGKDRKDQEEQRALTRLRIGHTRLTHSDSFKTGGKQCVTCGVPLTVAHILLECRKYDQERAKHKIDSNLGIVLANEAKEEEKLLAFLRETGLFKEL